MFDVVLRPFFGHGFQIVRPGLVYFAEHYNPGRGNS